MATYDFLIVPADALMGAETVKAATPQDAVKAYGTAHGSSQRVACIPALGVFRAKVEATPMVNVTVTPEQ